MDNKLKRFKNDVKYDILVSPFGYDYYNMTPKEATANFEWFLSIIPERMDYFRNRCSNDLRISVDLLDYSAESLILVWRWFLSVARMEKTPKDILKKMREGAELFGDSFINQKQFTVSSQFMMRDIGIYVGQA